MLYKIKNRRLDVTVAILPGLHGNPNDSRVYPFLLLQRESFSGADKADMRKIFVSWGIAEASNNNSQDNKKLNFYPLNDLNYSAFYMINCHYHLEANDIFRWMDSMSEASGCSLEIQAEYEAGYMSDLAKTLKLAQKREDCIYWQWRLCGNYSIWWPINPALKAEIEFGLQKLLLKVHHNAMSKEFPTRKKKLAKARIQKEKGQSFRRTNLSSGTRRRVMERDGFACVDCGRNPRNNPGCILEVDHRVPIAKGGSNDDSNLQTLCDLCNRGKGSNLDWKLVEIC